jgi:hypothetical protein
VAAAIVPSLFGNTYRSSFPAGIAVSLRAYIAAIPRSAFLERFMEREMRPESKMH